MPRRIGLGGVGGGVVDRYVCVEGGWVSKPQVHNLPWIRTQDQHMTVVEKPSTLQSSSSMIISFLSLNSLKLKIPLGSTRNLYYNHSYPMEASML